MSEWFYIWLSFGLTWVVIGGYAGWLRSRRVAAEDSLRNPKGGL